VTFAELSTIPSLPSEERGPLAEPSRFGTLARRVWHPLQMSEELR
jgi:exodeoxyribonuclease V gamma subunit